MNTKSHGLARGSLGLCPGTTKGGERGGTNDIPSDGKFKAAALAEAGISTSAALSDLRAANKKMAPGEHAPRASPPLHIAPLWGRGASVARGTIPMWRARQALPMERNRCRRTLLYKAGMHSE